MKTKFALLPILLICLSFIFTACNTQKEDITEDSAFSESVLRNGSWMLNHVDVNSFDLQGNLTNTERFLFGPNTDGGICTFTYGEDKIWTLDDNGEIFTARYSMDDRIVYTEGGGTWGIRKMDDNSLEIVLRSDETLNPCNYTVSGAVYTFTRAKS